MSDKPTSALLAAIKAYDSAFSSDKKFSRVRAALAAVSEEASKLDPRADEDEAAAGKDEPRQSQVGREPAVTSQKGHPEAHARLHVEEDRHRNDEGQNDPPLKRAAKQARQIFRDARRTASEARAEESSDDSGRK